MNTSTPTAAAGPVIHFPTPQEEATMTEEFFTRLRLVEQERDAAVAVGRLALARLCEVMQRQTGQGFRLRGLLRSLWNGNNGADLNGVVCLDWELRKDFNAVLLAFGAGEFFYDELRAAVTAAGLWEWFLEGLPA